MKKRVLIFSGNHARHIFINKTFLDFDIEIAVILMKREDLIPVIDEDLKNIDKENMKKHFQDRYIKEKEKFGFFNSNSEIKKIFKKNKLIECDPDYLNSQTTLNFVQDFNPDFVFIFGVNMIKSPVIENLPIETINLHLGLSPWYKGSATLFWPFYFLEPQYAGATFHKIIDEPDAGDILHQSVPILSKKDGIHDIGVKTVVEARNDLSKIIKKLMKGEELIFQKQKKGGKNFLTSDFKPEHLRFIYQSFDNEIVNFYLENIKKYKIPKIIKFV